MATALVASNMVGSGIFLLPATLAPIGGISLLGWLVATAGALAVALGFARLATTRPLAGGPCAYAEQALGRGIGFQAYMLYILVCWVGNVGVGVAAVAYLASLLPALAHGWVPALAVVALTALFAALNAAGARLVCVFESISIFAGLLPIALICTLGWAHFDPQLFARNWNPGHVGLLHSIPQSVLMVFWAFLGLESASVAAAVVENPKRNIPIATVGGVLLSAVVYIAACGIIFGLVPQTQLAQSTAPFALAAQVLFGPVAGTLIAVAALIKTLGTFSGWLLLGAQTGQAGAAAGFMPRRMALVNAAGVPIPALVAAASTIAIVALATHSGTVNQQFELISDASVLMSLLLYAYALVALVRQRSAGIDWAWLLLGGGFCLWVIMASERRLIIALAVLVVVCTLAYMLGAGRRRPDGET